MANAGVVIVTDVGRTQRLEVDGPWARVAFDSQHWSLPLSRWVTGTRPDQEGRFRVRNMPPGSYNIIAVDYVEAGSWGDPELLERLKAHARRITLTDGGSERVELKLADQY